MPHQFLSQGVENHLRKNSGSPEPLRMGANGVVQEGRFPLTTSTDVEDEEVEEFMTPPTHPPSARSTPCVACAEVLHEEDDEEESKHIVFHKLTHGHQKGIRNIFVFVNSG